MVSKDLHVEHLVLDDTASNCLFFYSARSSGRNCVVTRVTLFTQIMLAESLPLHHLKHFSSVVFIIYNIPIASVRKAFELSKFLMISEIDNPSHVTARGGFKK